MTSGDETAPPPSSEEPELDPRVATAMVTAAAMPLILGAITLTLDQEAELSGDELAPLALSVGLGSVLVPAIAWFGVGEGDAAWLNLALNGALLALGALGGVGLGAALDEPLGQTAARAMLATSMAVLPWTAFVAATQTASFREGFGIDEASRSEAGSVGAGAVSAVALGALAFGFSQAPDAPAWGPLAASLGGAMLAPAIGWALAGEWQRAGESVLAGLTALALAAVVALVASPFVVTQDPDIGYERAIAVGLALGSAVYVPISALVHSAIVGGSGEATRR